MDACLVMEKDGSRLESEELQARLVIVYSGAIGASDNRTFSPRNVKNPTDTFCAIWDVNSGRNSLYQQ